MVQYIRTQPGSFGGPAGHLANIAAFTLLFACFMRIGEVAYPAFDSRFDLFCGSLSLPERPGGVATLTISASKTDPFRTVVSVVIPTGPANVCPVRAIRRYLASRRHTPQDPLFTCPSGGFPRLLLTRSLPIAPTQRAPRSPATRTLVQAGCRDLGGIHRHVLH